MAFELLLSALFLAVAFLSAANAGFDYDEITRRSTFARANVIDFLKSINSRDNGKTVAAAGILDNGQKQMVPFTNIKVYFEDPRPGGAYGRTSGYAGSQFILSTFVVSMLIENDPQKTFIVRLPGLQFLIQCTVDSRVAEVKNIHEYDEKPLASVGDIEKFFGRSRKVTSELGNLVKQYVRAFLDNVMLAPANENARKCPADE